MFSSLRLQWSELSLEMENRSVCKVPSESFQCTSHRSANDQHGNRFHYVLYFIHRWTDECFSWTWKSDYAKYHNMSTNVINMQQWCHVLPCDISRKRIDV